MNTKNNTKQQEPKEETPFEKLTNSVHTEFCSKCDSDTIHINKICVRCNQE